MISRESSFIASNGQPYELSGADRTSHVANDELKICVRKEPGNEVSGPGEPSLMQRIIDKQNPTC
jgi:hypothetical protein